MLIASTTTAAHIVKTDDAEALERAARAHLAGKIVIVLAAPEEQEALVRKVMETAENMPTMPAGTMTVITEDPKVIEGDWTIVKKGAKRFDLCFKGQTLAEAATEDALLNYQPHAKPFAVRGKWRLPQTATALAEAKLANVAILSR